MEDRVQRTAFWCHLVSYKNTQSHINDSAPTILIVDDEPQICEFVRWVLEDAGYLTSVAESGPSAIDFVAACGYPDLLLTDLKMPQMYGDELAAKLRRGRPELKVLYLTGLSQELFRHREGLHQWEAVLEKPCSAREILQGISLLLSGSATHCSARQ
jgi:two-component system, cell cycle sensor histidine kinase and response regulator CckA